MTNPIDLLHIWLEEEHNAGAPNPKHAVLSTATRDAVPHSRVIAIREISDKGLVFFTQKGTRKVSELNTNPIATMTFWFELLQREVIIEGEAFPLSDTENEQYWQSYSREAQVRFYSYAPTSSQPISDKQILEAKKKQIELEYDGKLIPINPLYCGFLLHPSRVVFYSYRTDELSDVTEYSCIDNNWTTKFLSP